MFNEIVTMKFSGGQCAHRTTVGAGRSKSRRVAVVLRRWSRYALVLAVPLFGSAPAWAQVACGDSTCPRGFSCRTHFEQQCPLVLCEEDCPPCTEPKPVSVCEAEPCSSDLDCDEGMVCTNRGGEAFGSDPSSSCEGGDCPKREANDAAASTVANPSYCVPRWRLNCSSAADCGDGFNCVEQESCRCSGSGGDGGSGADMSAASSEESCSCAPTGQKACEVIEVACVANADCPLGFTCSENHSRGCTLNYGGPTSCTPAKLCIPPYPNLTRLSDGAPALSPGSKFEGAKDGAEAAGPSGGCSITPPGSPGSGAPLVLVLGAAFGLSRRRRSDD